jgi:hypothetical protein
MKQPTPDPFEEGNKAATGDNRSPLVRGPVWVLIQRDFAEANAEVEAALVSQTLGK